MMAHLEDLLPDVIAFRRDVHAHPELSHQEFETTEKVCATLSQAGLHPQRLGDTGLICDIGPDHPEGRLGIRTDLDALPIIEETDCDYSSTRPGISHACGHDVHTAIGVGTALLLARAQEAGLLHSSIRILFQPAEEAKDGGAQDFAAAGAMTNVSRIVALHCDPGLDVGRVGLRVGPMTSAADMIFVHLTGTGGHTSRPHLTADVVYALGHLITTLPGVLSRRLDPRGGTSIVWGHVQAGSAPNAIPRTGTAAGTVRCLDAAAWQQCELLLPVLIENILSPFGVDIDIEHHRVVPPVVNDEDTVNLLVKAGRYELGNHSVVPTEQSLGGEDFAWYLQDCPGALARLGTRTPGGPTYDLHRGDFFPDERCLPVGIRLLTNLALNHAYLAIQPTPIAALPEQSNNTHG